MQHTLQHLTDGLTDNQQTDLGSTVTDTAGNLLDAVGDVGNTLVDTVGGTLDSVGSALPTASPSRRSPERQRQTDSRCPSRA